MENCQIALQSPDSREFRTVPASDYRSLAARRSQGWVIVRIFRANLPWPAGQRLTCCVNGHLPTSRNITNRRARS